MLWMFFIVASRSFLINYFVFQNKKVSFHFFIVVDCCSSTSFCGVRFLRGTCVPFVFNHGIDQNYCLNWTDWILAVI